MKRILIMAGGTGGHVFPALAVARHLRQQGHHVAWLGTATGLEADVIPKAGIPIYFLNIKGLRGKRWASLLLAPYRIFHALYQAFNVIHKVEPDVVLGLGGYVTGPGGIAAWLLRKKLVIHEQNAIAGLTNKILSHFAQHVLQAFPDTFKKAIDKVMTVGNPVRESITQLTPPDQRYKNRTGRLRVLVIGGSRGAHALNTLLPSVIELLTPEQRPDIKHQTGQADCEQTEIAYRHLLMTPNQGEAINIEVSAFIDDMSAVYNWADLVICRAGALTVSEVAAAGIAALFVPYPFAVDDHQTKNANALVAAQAGLVIQQADLTAEVLAKLLKQYVQDREPLLTMAQNAWQLRRLDATQLVSQVCLS